MNAAPRAGLREWVGLAVLALPTFIVAIDIFVLLVALPELSRSLGADSTQQLWVTDVYGFLLAGFLLTMGNLGDRIGRRRLLMIGSLAFGVISLVTAYATTPTQLILGRAGLGIAGATLMPSTLALIANLFQDPKQRARAFGLWGSVFTLGAIAGPVLGGLLLTKFWWGSVFVIAAPIMVALLIAAPRFLPEYRNPVAGPFDAASVALSLAAMLPAIYGIKRLAVDGMQSVPLLMLVVGGWFGVQFIRRQQRLASPLLDVSLFQNRSIVTALISQLGYSVVGGGVMLFMMLYFQLVHGLSPVQAGLAMVPGMAAASVGFAVLPSLATRYRPALVIGAGMAGTAAVLLVFSQVGGAATTTTLVVGFAVFSFCGSALVALGTNIIVGAAPPERAGSAGALAQMSNEFGGTLGNALLGTLGFAVYRLVVADELPANLPPETKAAAKDSIAGAVDVASSLPAATAETLLSPARSAFVDALNVVAGVGAILLAGVSALVLIRLRHLAPIGQAPAENSPEMPTEPR